MRKQLRKKKEYELADTIRARLAELGVELKDKGEETVWSYSSPSSTSSTSTP